MPSSISAVHQQLRGLLLEALHNLGLGASCSCSDGSCNRNAGIWPHYSLPFCLMCPFWCIALDRIPFHLITSGRPCSPDEFHLNNVLTRHSLRCKLHVSRVWDEKCSLLGYYAASRINFLPTFRDNLSVPYSKVKPYFISRFGDYNYAHPTKSNPTPHLPCFLPSCLGL
jgi:hypothetical protein